MRSRQLAFVFADSPQGSKGAGPTDVSDGRAFLLHITKGKATSDLIAPAADTDRLLEQAASASNLATALLNVARNKGAPGVDGCSVDEVVGAARSLLPTLRRALLEGDYQPGDIRRVWIPKPGGGQRGLGIPNVIDRWVQQAVLQVLEPIFEPTFHDSSHGFRPSRGAHTAIAQAKAYLREGHEIVVDLDLSKFFDRVHHQRLISRLAQRIADPRILKLICQMLKAKVVMPDGTRVSTEEGTPQGGPLSPLLSNVVLDEFDWELQRRGLRFVRYADDCNVFVRSLRAGQRVMASIRRFLECRLRLLVNEEKSKVARPEEIHFLGFRLRKAPEGKVEVHVSAHQGAVGCPDSGSDAPDLGPIAGDVHRGGKPLPARLDRLLPDLHGGERTALPPVRCPHPATVAGDHHPAEETIPPSLPASAALRRERGCCRADGLLPSRRLESEQYAGHDSGLPKRLVSRAVGVAEGVVV